MRLAAAPADSPGRKPSRTWSPSRRARIASRPRRARQRAAASPRRAHLAAGDQAALPEPPRGRAARPAEERPIEVEERGPGTGPSGFAGRRRASTTRPPRVGLHAARSSARTSRLEQVPRYALRGRGAAASPSSSSYTGSPSWDVRSPRTGGSRSPAPNVTRAAAASRSCPRRGRRFPIPRRPDGPSHRPRWAAERPMVDPCERGRRPGWRCREGSPPTRRRRPDDPRRGARRRCLDLLRDRADRPRGLALRMGPPQPTGAPASDGPSRSAGSSGIGSQQWGVELPGEVAHRRRAEDVPGHVLDDAEQPHVGLLRHRAGARSHLLREPLRRRHRPPSARRSSWPSEIETSPVPGGMSTTSTSSSPRGRRTRNCSSARCNIGPRHITGWLPVQEEPDRHQLQAVLHRRDDHARPPGGALVDAEDVRDRLAIDVRVEHTTLRPSRESATARFAATGDLPTPPLPLATASTRQSLGSRITPSRSGCAAAQLLRQRLPLLRRHHVEGELDSRHARDARERLLHLLLERVAQRAAGHGEDDRERDDAVVAARDRAPCRAR